MQRGGCSHKDRRVGQRFGASKQSSWLPTTTIRFVPLGSRTRGIERHRCTRHTAGMLPGISLSPHLRGLLTKGVLVAGHLRGEVLVVALLTLKVCLQDGHSLLIQVLVLVLLHSTARLKHQPRVNLNHTPHAHTNSSGSESLKSWQAGFAAQYMCHGAGGSCKDGPHLQCLNLVQALSVLNQLCKGVVAAATRHALQLLTDLSSQNRQTAADRLSVSKQSMPDSCLVVSRLGCKPF